MSYPYLLLLSPAVMAVILTLYVRHLTKTKKAH